MHTKQEIEIDGELELEGVSELIVREYLTFSSVLLLKGDLGAGKTTLVKYLASSLGVQDEIGSPTYTIVNEYVTVDNEVLYHFDFYRINQAQEALDLGWFEYIDSGNICIVEWPEKIEAYLPNRFVLIELEKDESKGLGHRLIKLSKNDL